MSVAKKRIPEAMLRITPRTLFGFAYLGVAMTLMLVAIITASQNAAKSRMLKEKTRLMQTELLEMRKTFAEIVSLEEVAAMYGIGRVPLECVTAERIESIRIEGGADAELGIDAIERAFRSCKKEMVRSSALFDGLSDELLYSAFAAVVASRLAPYGATSELKQVEDIFLSSNMNCGPQAILVSVAAKRYNSGLTVRHVGFTNRFVGNHGMVVIDDGTDSIFVCPTVAVICNADFDEVLEGYPVSLYQMIDFFAGDDEELEQFRRQLRGALRSGGIRKSDLIFDIEVDEAYLEGVF